MNDLDQVLANDDAIRDQLIFALQQAIRRHFTETDWAEFGYSTGTSDYIQSHPRLLRSLRFGDGDYGKCVFDALEYLAQYKLAALEALLDHPKLRLQLEKDHPAIGSALGYDTQHVQAAVPTALSGAEVVARALADAEQLLASSGPISAVDRLHTALHGYFRYLCEDVGIQIAKDASLTVLFKTLREQHSALQFIGQHDKDMVRILNGFANVLDAINTVRNNASVAHPNAVLVGEPEAYLVINATRTVYNYVAAKAGR